VETSQTHGKTEFFGFRSDKVTPATLLIESLQNRPSGINQKSQPAFDLRLRGTIILIKHAPMKSAIKELIMTEYPNDHPGTLEAVSATAAAIKPT
jgi:hypothetical protein